MPGWCSYHPEKFKTHFLSFESFQIITLCDYTQYLIFCLSCTFSSLHLSLSFFAPWCTTINTLYFLRIWLKILWYFYEIILIYCLLYHLKRRFLSQRSYKLSRKHSSALNSSINICSILNSPCELEINLSSSVSFRWWQWKFGALLPLILMLSAVYNVAMLGWSVNPGPVYRVWNHKQQSPLGCINFLVRV